MSNKNKSQEAIIAILSELEESGIRSLTVTSLVKFVYLVDYAHAKANAGQTLTGVPWRFLHYGPFDATVMTDIDILDSRSILNKKSGGGVTKDYVLYALSESIPRSTLEAIGLVKGAASRVRQYLQDYSRNQSKLLNFVYFHTEPMDEARPEALLDFSVCRADTWQDIRPIKANPIPPAALKAFRARMAARRLVEDVHKPAPLVWEGPYDDMYHHAMAALDADEGVAVASTGTTGVLIL